MESCLNNYVVNNCLESARAGSAARKHYGTPAVPGLCAQPGAELRWRTNFWMTQGSGREEGAGTLPCQHHQPSRESVLV